MLHRRVKITGIGPVTPAGIGKEAFWRGILEPVSRVRAVPRLVREGTGTFVAAEVGEFNLSDYFPSFQTRHLPKHTEFALVGAQLALVDAGLRPEDIQGLNPFVIVGAALMDFGIINHTFDTIAKKGKIIAFPYSVAAASVASISSMIAEWVGGSCRTLAVQSACCSGTDAIGHAAEKIASGEAEFAICGGTDAPIHLHPMLEMKKAKLSSNSDLMPEKTCRPFDRWRTTGAIGEGAAIFVLEPEESPRPGYGFIDGYAYATDPIEEPLSGLEHAMRMALANARLSPQRIESINAWGPGHPMIDAAEARVLRAVFGESLSQIPAFSIKGAIGNPLGAAGPIQLAATLIGMKEGILPPTVNWEYPDPACPLCLSGSARYVAHGTALIDAHGLSGTNACLVVRSQDPAVQEWLPGWAGRGLSRGG
ncbi:MAG: beta-ketoacyl synthase N-terminal-like domain-containing protein [Opitutaceae bacterium]|jgi:3-oxoacyl-(acyl-carrier-protein) synthase